jgi:Permuted papain-like amidase enzyme, YaeF/YiiX, C92 family
MKETSVIITLILLMAACANPAPPPEQSEDQLKQMAIRKENDSLVKLAKSLVKPGDLLLRTGNDFASDEIKAFSKQDKTYSHGGIAVADSTGIYVYHIEPDFNYIHDKVRKEPLDSFCDPAKNLGFAIGRYDLNKEENKSFLIYLQKQFDDKVAFDMVFDLKSDHHMYCSEMIRKGLLSATKKRISIKVDKLDDRRKYKLIKQYFKVPEQRFANMDVVMIDQLYLNPHCTLIQKFSFKQP